MAEVVQDRGGEARLVARVAHDDEPARRVGDALVAVRSGRIAAPLEHVARDEDAARHDAVALALALGADVDEHRAGAHGVGGLRGVDALEALARLGEQVIDGPARSRPRPSGVKLLHTVEAIAPGSGILVDLDARDPLDPLKAAAARRDEPARRTVAVRERAVADARGQ